MASIFHLICDGSHITSHIIQKDRGYELDRIRFHYASIVIQKQWRGYLARKEIQEMHDAATVIQKYVRRFLVRINFANYLLTFLEYRAMKFYNKMAAKIQAYWKGYKFRKENFDFRKIYAQKQKVAKINQELKERMRREKEEAAEEERKEAENEAKYLVLFILFKLHHLLRTHKEGIYSIHNSRQLSYIEKLLKSIKFTQYMKALRKLYNETYCDPPERECILKGRWQKCEKAYYRRDKNNDPRPAPPINPLDFLHEKPFSFDPRISRKYEPPVMTQGKYGNIIREVLRDFDSSLNITNTDFELTKKVAELKALVPAYYLDFWNRFCGIHNCVEY